MIFHWLKKQKGDIISLQETHIKKGDEKFLINLKLGLNFFSVTNKKVKGIVCYINKDLHPKEIFSDNDGRYLPLEIDLNREKTIVGVYPPNDSKRKLF